MLQFCQSMAAILLQFLLDHRWHRRLCQQWCNNLLRTATFSHSGRLLSSLTHNNWQHTLEESNRMLRVQQTLLPTPQQSRRRRTLGNPLYLYFSTFLLFYLIRMMRIWESSRILFHLSFVPFSVLPTVRVWDRVLAVLRLLPMSGSISFFQATRKKVKKDWKKVVTDGLCYKSTRGYLMELINFSFISGWCRNKKYIEKVENGFMCTVCRKIYGRPQLPLNVSNTFS